MQSLNLLLKRLTDAGIEFIIVGGYAGVLHGSSLVTRNVEIFAILSPEQVSRLREALKGLNACHRMSSQNLSFEDHPDPAVPVKNLHLRTDLGILDILGSVKGLGNFKAVRDRAEWVQLNDQRCRVLCLSDVITAKEAMGREKDLLAVKELKALGSLNDNR